METVSLEFILATAGPIIGAVGGAIALVYRNSLKTSEARHKDAEETIAYEREQNRGLRAELAERQNKAEAQIEGNISAVNGLQNALRNLTDELRLGRLGGH